MISASTRAFTELLDAVLLKYHGLK